MGPVVRKTTFPNGFRVVTEHHPLAKSLSMGLWVCVGTRDEKPRHGGMAHLTEHMVFKGTKKRSAYQIAKSLESVGGDLNAYTSREQTVIHATMLAPDWKVGVDLLQDLALNMSWASSQFDLEKTVVIQEIGMAEDQVEDVLFDRFFSEVFTGHPLAAPILGTKESLARIEAKDLWDFYRRAYSPNHMLLAVAGQVDHDAVVSAVSRGIGSRERKRTLLSRTAPKPKLRRWIEDRPGEQVHVLAGLPVGGFQEKERMEAYVVNALLGGGMTSRLYQEVREKRGLVYSISSFLSSFEDAGLLQVYAACEPAHLRSVLVGIRRELQRIRELGVSRHDLNLFRRQVYGAIMLGSEDMENRMTSLAMNEWSLGRYRPLEETLEDLEAVSVASLENFIERWIHPNRISLGVMGNSVERKRDWLLDFDFAAKT